MSLLAATLGVCLVSAILPLINAELYLAAVATQVGPLEAVPLAIAAALGQTLGKVVWFVGTQRGLDSRWMRKRLAKPKAVAAREKWQARADGRPWFMGGINFCSGFFGFPPMLVMPSVAATVGMSMTMFVTTTMVGRTLRFYAILAGIALVWV